MIKWLLEIDVIRSDSLENLVVSREAATENETTNEGMLQEDVRQVGRQVR